MDKQILLCVHRGCRFAGIAGGSECPPGRCKADEQFERTMRQIVAARNARRVQRMPAQPVDMTRLATGGAVTLCKQTRRARS